MLIKDTRKLVMISCFIALNIILTRFLSIQTPFLRIGFAFLPISLCAMLYGPVVGGVSAVIADILGMFLFVGGAFHYGFTISAFLSGTIYGLFLYKRPKTFFNVLVPVFLILTVVDLGLNTFWLKDLYNKGFLVLLPQRAIKAAIMLPIQTTLITVFWKYVHTFLETTESKKIA